MACKGCVGHCKRRDKTLSPTHARLCSRRKHYALAWDRIHGVVDDTVIPDSFTFDVIDEATQKKRAIRRKAAIRAPRNKTPAPGLGDVIESALTAVGITSDRVESWLGKKCNCKARKEKLNKLSKWASQVLTATTKDAASHGDSFDRIVGKKRL